MKKALLILLFSGLFITACNDDTSLLGPKEYISSVEMMGDDGVNPHLNGKMVTRPFKVRSQGFLGPDFTSTEPECGEAPLFAAIGEGIATHLGNFDVTIKYCVDISTGFPISSLYAVQIAANGDELYSMGYAVPTMVPTEVIHYYDYYGGSGRFEEATGSVMLYVTFDPVTGAWSARGEGEITY
jgi:hypothetical protein